MRILAIIGLVAAGFVVTCTVVYPRAIIHARITVSVDTPEGPRSGSSVVQLGYATEPRIGNAGFSMGLGAGEAVVVDLGARGALYALLVGRGRDGRSDAGQSHASMLLDVFRAEIGGYGSHEELVRRLQSLEGQAVVPGKYLPMLVRFRDERDPRTVEAVDPADLSKSFGPGVLLERVTIEIVPSGWWPLNLFGIGGEPVTRGIAGRLGWLDLPWEERRKQNWGPMWTGYGSLNGTYFRRGN